MSYETIFTLEPDEYAEVAFRLDKAHYDELAVQVRILALVTPIEVCLQPGDLTWYSLLFVPMGTDRVVGASGGGMVNGSQPSSFFWPADTMIIYGQAGTSVTFERATVDARQAAQALSPENVAGQVAIHELLRRVYPKAAV